MVSWFRKLFLGGLDRVTSELLRHTSLSMEALGSIRAVVVSVEMDGYAVDEVVRRTAALEKEGDEIIRALSDALAQGLVAPTLASTLQLLLDNVDNVLDEAFFMAKEVGRGFRLWRNQSLTGILRGLFREMLDLDRSALEYFQAMLRAGPVEEAKRYARLITSLEEEIDEVKERALDEVYKYDFSAVEFNHVSSLIYAADKIADNVQDAAFHYLAILSAI